MGGSLCQGGAQNMLRVTNCRRITTILCAGAVIVVSWACGGEGEQKQAPPEAAAPPAAVPAAPAVAPAISINELMVAWIDHSGHALWDVEPEGRAPKTDAEWREVERHAIQLAASGPLLTLGGTGQADPGWAQSPDWKTHAQGMSNAAMEAVSAARAKNFEALVKANGRLVETCENCHNQFKPELPTEGKTHQPH
jgi:hypothetical protein